MSKLLQIHYLLEGLSNSKPKHRHRIALLNKIVPLTNEGNYSKLTFQIIIQDFNVPIVICHFCQRL